MVEYSAYVGLDVHKETISVAAALAGREDQVFPGEIRNQRSSLRRLIGRLSPDGEVISFCYEAGPCGYGVYREIVATGHHCEVVAPSLIPRRAGDRVKTDRRDAVTRRCGGVRRSCTPDHGSHDGCGLLRGDAAAQPPGRKNGARKRRQIDIERDRLVEQATYG